MTSFSSVAIPHPKNWQDFERNCRILFKCILNDPNAQTNGRPGQRQHGVDIFGRRGGNGQYVGIQCKGKDTHFGQQITVEELRAETNKTEKFQPPIAEFIIVTTAADDAKIQEGARTLTEELAESGRKLQVSVMGWGTLEQEISQYREAIKAFQPDATPFTDDILATVEHSTKMQERTSEDISDIRKKLTVIASNQIQASTSPSSRSDTLEQYLHQEIDDYRDLIRHGRAETALGSLEAMRGRCFSSASDRVRFRILTNMGAAKLSLGLEREAALLFLEAYPLDPNDSVASSNRAVAHLILGNRTKARDLAIAELERNPTNIGAAVARLQSADPNESAEEVSKSFLREIREDPTLLQTIVRTLRARQHNEWRLRALEFKRAHPQNLMAIRLAAEATLESFQKVPGAILGQCSDAIPSTISMRNAVNDLEIAWNECLKCTRTVIA